MRIGRNSDNGLEGQIDGPLPVGAMPGAKLAQAMTEARQYRKPSLKVCPAGEG